MNPASTPGAALRSVRPRRRALVGLVAVASLAFAACGGGEPSAEEAEEILMTELTEELDLDEDVARCITDEALARHEPGELVNSSGEATAEVNASVAEITKNCMTTGSANPVDTTVPDTTVPETTVAPTTVPETTVAPTTVPETTVAPTTTSTTVASVDLTSFCASSTDVLVVLYAASQMNESPAPASVEAFFSEAIDRTELALVTAPSPEFAAQPQALLTALERFDAAAADAAYDVEQVPNDILEEEFAIIDESEVSLESFLADNCDVTIDIDASAAELAAEFTALGGESGDDDDPGDDTSDGIRSVVDTDSGIDVDVPATWTDQRGTTEGDTRTLVVGPSVDEYESTWAADGVRITAVDGSSDWAALVPDTDSARECDTEVSQEEYDDGVYVGTLYRYEGCGTQTETVVIGATDDAGTIAIIVEFQMVDFDESQLTIITSSFFV